MSNALSRRSFLQNAAMAGTFVGAGDFSFLSTLPPVSAAEMSVDAETVRLTPELEPLVRLLEDTPRERLLEEVAARIRRGLTYRQLLAALFLAAVRNVQPRPSVGFKFHAVLVVNSVHLAAMASPETDRWLPIFWALDYFKDSQARDVREGNWTMGPVDESAVPSAEKSRTAFVDAMDAWDEPAADAAIAGLSRSAPKREVFELFYRFGSRDFRSIGHKAIFVANAQRTLDHIGWDNAEPVLRSLAYALLMHEDGNPAERDAEADRPWRQNQEIAKRIRGDLQAGEPSSEATAELLDTLRTGDYRDASAAVVELLKRGVNVQSVWDGLFCGAAELLLRQPGIVALHAVTTTNAIHYAFNASENDKTRKLLLLQNAAFLPMFRQAMRGRGQVRDAAIDALQPEDPVSNDEEVVRDIFAEMPGNRTMAARKTLAYLGSGGKAEALLSTARRLLLLKGNDAHDYKFGSAALEDFTAISPGWRNRFLAACMMQLCGSGEQDSSLVKRTRAALDE